MMRACVRPFGLRFSSSEVGANIHEVTTSAFNVKTSVKAQMKLTERLDVPAKKAQRLYSLPKEAINGLYKAIQNVEKEPRVLQHDSDQLTQKIIHRKMPADPEEVRLARKNDNIRAYKWKPTVFKTRDEGSGYALSRLSSNYAEAKFVLDQLDSDSFTPESILDYGSGVGGVFWAAREKWDESLKDYCAVDPNTTANHLAMDIMRKDDNKLISPYVSFRRSIIPSTKQKYDIVVAQRVLPEVPSFKSRIDLISLLWSRTNKYLVLIESSLLDSFTALMEMRDFLLLSGYRFNKDNVKQQLEREGKLTQDVLDVLNDRRATIFEKYKLLKNKINITTEIDPGYLFAPCPHDSGCPHTTSNGYSEACAFQAKIPELRLDGKSKSIYTDRTLRAKFTYMIFKKGEREVGQKVLPRIVKVNNCGNHQQCDVCTAFNGLQRFTVSKRLGHSYNRIRSCKEGQLLPYNEEILKAEDENVDMINQIYNQEKAQFSN
ncbi:unnamed protein product [Bursaphelenchus okinawaensis]|uniref:Uncharacterized protein n=1 Tax=Bursaphelenchus okinawaensis TaxID=465554 RepID=A0A811JS55_9BILA|nr:unnamed protein product [Bursaphelenchus okinawaensis]CAG9080590.1 unnamed protein product [Bursaphelenchus okinawaensis]